MAEILHWVALPTLPLKLGPCKDLFDQNIVRTWNERRLTCRLGPPRFLGGILIIWGIVASLFAWMRTAAQFYILRFILGLAESGAYPGLPNARLPGMLLLLSYPCAFSSTFALPMCVSFWPHDSC